MIITTTQGFEIVRIINKLGIQDELLEAILEIHESNNKLQRAYAKLKKIILLEHENYDDLTEEDKKLININTLTNNEELATEIGKLQGTSTKIGGSLIFTLITRIPQAEKELIKIIANIYNMKVKEVEDKGLDFTVNCIKEIATSETIMGFFKLLHK